MNGGDTMENKRTEMTSGGAGYGMAIRAGQRSGKMQELLDVLRERCEELERERENLLILCDQLKRDNERGEIELLAEADWGQQRRDERDEARQWACRRHRVAQQWRTRYNESIGRIAVLRAQLAEARGSEDSWKTAAHMWERSCSMRRESGAILQQRLVEVRNKALDEAIAVCENLRCNEGYPFLGAQFCARDIRALKNAGAYPADEINTVGDGS